MADLEGEGDRPDTDIFYRYKYGEFGTIPLPDLTPVLTDGDEEAEEQE